MAPQLCCKHSDGRMLPELTAEGELRPGVNIADWQEFGARFRSSSPRRVWLSVRLRILLELAATGGKLRRIFVWGNFVTVKPAPAEIDLLLIMDEDFETERITASAQATTRGLRPRSGAGQCFRDITAWDLLL